MRPRPPASNGTNQDGQAKKEEVRYWIPVLLTLIGVLLAAIPVYLSFQPDTPEEFLAECRANHPDSAEAPATRTNTAERSFSGCSWPPVPGAASDGFYQVRLTEYEIPGSVGADQFSLVQVFSSACRTLLLQYRFQNQTTNAQEQPLVVDTDQIVSMYDGSPENVPSDLWPVAGADSEGRLLVLSHFRYDLSRVECVSPSSQ